MSKEETEVWQGTIAILPDYQGKEYGREALMLIEAEYPEAKIWCLSTILQEKQLVKLYEGLGYRKEKNRNCAKEHGLGFYGKEEMTC